MASFCVPSSVLDPDPHPDLHQIKIRIRIRIKVISWFRIRISLQMTSQNVWNMSLFEHFLDQIKIRIRIRTGINIKVINRIRIRIKVMHIAHWFRTPGTSCCAYFKIREYFEETTIGSRCVKPLGIRISNVKSTIFQDRKLLFCCFLFKKD
jgi:hypothetical protein